MNSNFKKKKKKQSAIKIKKTENFVPEATSIKLYIRHQKVKMR